MLSDEQREAEDAATRLQAISRGHRDRQAVERTQTLKKEREQAASLLQTRQRGRIACREVDERREQTQAATSIGKVYRGKQTRRARIDRGPRSCDRDDVASGLHTLGRTADLRHAYLGCSVSGLQLTDVPESSSSRGFSQKKSVSFPRMTVLERFLWRISIGARLNAQ